LPTILNTYAELGDKLDPRPEARLEYEQRVASMPRVLDIGGRNQQSKSARRLRAIGRNPQTEIVSTDILPDYDPDLVDDIVRTTIPPSSFDGVYCDAILEHVKEYWDAVDNIRSILKPGGEAFIYVPFCFYFHDQMDYHRFTITEVARMLDGFSEVKVFTPGDPSGYGYVVWHTLSYGVLERYPRVFAALSRATNTLLRSGIDVWYRRKRRPFTLEQARFFLTQVNFNHGFCAWVRK